MSCGESVLAGEKGYSKMMRSIGVNTSFLFQICLVAIAPLAGCVENVAPEEVLEESAPVEVDSDAVVSISHSITSGVEKSDLPIVVAAETLCGIVYDDQNLRGTRNELSNNEQQAFPNARISSLIIGPSCTITLRDAQNVSKAFAGGSGGTTYWFVGSDWNDRATRATCTCTTAPNLAARVYENANYGGSVFPVWNYTYGELGPGWNDLASSINTNDGSSILLSENAYTGQAYVRTGTDSSFVGSSFNDLASRFASAGVEWNACAPTSRCFRSTSNCGGLAEASPDLIDCFRDRGGMSYCQAGAGGSGSVCIPSWVLGF
jgi:hypothetical protein